MGFEPTIFRDLVSTDALTTEGSNFSQFSELEQCQAKYKEFYDRGSKQLPQFKKGDDHSVSFRKPGDRHLSPLVVYY